MTNRLSRTLASSAAAVLFGAALALSATVDAQPASHYCEIAMDLAVSGRTVAQPSAIVEFGKPADITIGDDLHGWRFVVTADEPTVVRRASGIPVGIEIYELSEGKSFLRASPRLSVAPGQRADLDMPFGDDGRRAHLGLVANPRADSDVEVMRQRAGYDSQQ